MNKNSKILVGVSIAAIVVSVYYVLKNKKSTPTTPNQESLAAKKARAESLGITVEELDKMGH